MNVRTKNLFAIATYPSLEIHTWDEFTTHLPTRLGIYWSVLTVIYILLVFDEWLTSNSTGVILIIISDEVIPHGKCNSSLLIIRRVTFQWVNGMIWFPNDNQQTSLLIANSQIRHCKCIEWLQFVFHKFMIQ